MTNKHKHRPSIAIALIISLVSSLALAGGGATSPQGGTITSVLPTPGGGLVGGGNHGAVTLGIDPSAALSLGNAIRLSGVISPTTLGGVTQNNYSPTGISAVSTVLQDVSVATTITGIAASQTQGQVLTFQNVSSIANHTIVFTNEDSASAGANRLSLPGGRSLVVQGGGAVTFKYDGTAGRWRVWDGNVPMSGTYQRIPVWDFDGASLADSDIIDNVTTHAVTFSGANSVSIPTGTLSVGGDVHVGSVSGGDTIAATNYIGSDTSGSSYNIRIIDARTKIANMGPSLAFGGNTNTGAAGDSGTYGLIKLLADNGTNGDSAFGMGFYTHANGGGALGVSLTLNSDQSADFNSHLVHNVLDPVSAQDAATKAYVDSSTTGAISGTAGDLSVFTGTHAIGNYAGSSPSACAGGQAITSIALSAAGVISPSCSVFGSSSLTNGAGANVVTKSDGTNLVASSISDNGSTVSTSEALSAGATTTTTLHATGAATLDSTVSAAGITNTGANALNCAISPTALTGVQQDNYSPAGLATSCILRLTASSPTTISGLAAQPTGTLVEIRNLSTSSAAITLANSSGSSSAGNQFLFIADWIVPINASVTLRYSGSNWVIDHIGTYEFPQLTIDGASQHGGLATFGAGVTSTAGATTLGTTSVSGITNSGQRVDTGFINPTGLTGTINDWAPTGLATAQYVYATSANTGATTITGIAGGVDGKVAVIVADPANTSGNSITFSNESGSSSAVNRLSLSGGSPYVLGATVVGTLVVRYNGTTQRWQQVGGNTTQYNFNSTFVGQAAFQSVVTWTNVQSPAALASGTTNDYAPTSGQRYRLTPASGGSTISSLLSGVSTGTGRIAVLQNISTTDSITLLHDDGASGTAANRFLFTGLANRILRPGQACTIIYDGTSSRWRPIDVCGSDSAVVWAASQSTAVTGTQDDFALVASTTRLIVTSASGVTFRGFAGGVDGRILVIENATASSNISISNESSGSTAANRITGSNGNTLSIAGTGSQATLMYEASTSRWRIVSVLSLKSTSSDFIASVFLESAVTPTAISGSSNDYSINAAANTVRQDVSSAATLTGISATQSDGRLLVFHNIATAAGDTLSFTNEDSGSSAANRFTLPGGATFVLQTGQSCTFRYDGTSSRWRLIDGRSSQLQTQADTSTGTVNDFALTSGVGILRFNPASGLTITGLTGGIDGKQLIICNTSTSSDVTLGPENAGSTAANRILTTQNVNITLRVSVSNTNSCATLYYDGTSSRWRVTGSGSFTYNGLITAAAGVTVSTNPLTLTTVHIKTAGTAPTLSGCGTSPTITGSDVAGTVTEGTLATGCTITFAATYTTAPTCTPTSQAGLGFTYATSATALTITNVGSLASTGLDYVCIGH